MLKNKDEPEGQVNEREDSLSKVNAESEETDAADEYIAKIAEKIERGEAVSNEERTVWQRFMDWLARKFGVKMNEHDVVDALLESRRRLEGGQTETQRTEKQTENQQTQTQGESTENGRVHIKGGLNSRISEKMEKKLTPEQVKKLHLENFVLNEKYDQRHSLKGIYYKDGYAYSSNSHILIKVRTDYPAEWEGKIIDPKTGKQIEAKYPDADDVLTTYNSREDMVRVSPQEVLDALNIAAEVRKGATKTNYKISPDEVFVALDSTNGALGGRDYKTLIISAKYAKQLSDIIKNSDNVEVYTEGPCIRIIADGVEAVLMRVQNKFDDYRAADHSVIYNGKTYLGERVAEKMRKEAERLRSEAENLFGEPKEKALREADRIEGIIADAGNIKEFEAEDDLGKVDNNTNFSAEEKSGETSFMAEERDEGERAEENMGRNTQERRPQRRYTVSEISSPDGAGKFFQDENGSIDLVFPRENALAAIGLPGIPFRMTTNIANHIYNYHRIELGLRSNKGNVDKNSW